MLQSEFDILEIINAKSNAQIWSAQPFHCFWNEETGTAEWNISGLVACEERVCNFTNEMLNAPDLIISNSDTTIWQPGSNRTRPMKALFGSNASFTCSNGIPIISKCTSYLYTPKWDPSCERINFFAPSAFAICENES